MRVIFKGGPYDAESKEAQTTGGSHPKPVPFHYCHPPFEPEAKFVGDQVVIMQVDLPMLVYKLEEYWIDGKLHHYEYHYQGR
ncbi:hypothetical protein AAHD62_24150 [Enterobacter hormaechei]